MLEPEERVLVLLVVGVGRALLLESLL